MSKLQIGLMIFAGILFIWILKVIIISQVYTAVVSTTRKSGKRVATIHFKDARNLIKNLENYSKEEVVIEASGLRSVRATTLDADYMISFIIVIRYQDDRETVYLALESYFSYLLFRSWLEAVVEKYSPAKRNFILKVLMMIVKIPGGLLVW